MKQQMKPISLCMLSLILVDKIGLIKLNRSNEGNLRRRTKRLIRLIQATISLRKRSLVKEGYLVKYTSQKMLVIHLQTKVVPRAL